MIEWPFGVIRFKEPAHIVLDVSGVGYGIDVPLSTYENLPDMGEPVQLFTHHHVREEAETLFGFLTREERDVFEIFLGASGIGPKTSLGILSTVPVGEFARAVAENDLAVLTRIPGIGRKTAERLIVELRDKMKAYMVGVQAAGQTIEKRSPQAQDAIAGLEMLGTRPAAAAAAVAKAVRVLGKDADSQALLREALKHR